MSIALAVHGAAGRMGTRLIALAAADSEFTLAAALDAVGAASGRDAGEGVGIGRTGIIFADSTDRAFDVMIDFSSPAGTVKAVELCERAGRPLVIGTTGHSEAQLGRIDDAARRIAIVHAPNMSVGVNTMLRIVRQVAAMLGDEYDAEIVETHHRFKADAPSGTALALLAAIHQGREKTTDVVHGRRGAVGARPRGQIGMHAVRLGDTVGEHIVSFGALGETLSLRHEAHTRDTFAAGALRAAKWVISRPAGKYSMQDVLFGSDVPSAVGSGQRSAVSDQPG